MQALSRIGFEHCLPLFSTLFQDVPHSQRLSVKKKREICRFSLLGDSRSIHSMFLLENSEKCSLLVPH